MRYPIVILESPAYFKTVHNRQHNIQNNQVRPFLSGQPYSLLAIQRRDSLISLLLKIVIEHFYNIPVVFDYQDLTFTHTGYRRLSKSTLN